jgi:hypothetical protein
MMKKPLVAIGHDRQKLLQPTLIKLFQSRATRCRVQVITKKPAQAGFLVWLGIRDDYRTLVGLDNLGVVEVEDDTECAENSDV